MRIHSQYYIELLKYIAVIHNMDMLYDIITARRQRARIRLWRHIWYSSFLHPKRAPFIEPHNKPAPAACLRSSKRV